MIHCVENIENKTFLTVIGEMFIEYPEIIHMYRDIINMSITLEAENKDNFFQSIQSFFSSLKDMNLHLKEGRNQDREEKFVQEIKNQYNHFVQNEAIHKNKIQEIQERSEIINLWEVF